MIQHDAVIALTEEYRSVTASGDDVVGRCTDVENENEVVLSTGIHHGDFGSLHHGDRLAANERGLLEVPRYHERHCV